MRGNIMWKYSVETVLQLTTHVQRCSIELYFKYRCGQMVVHYSYTDFEGYQIVMDN